MSETETEIGWRIARGELRSPVRIANFSLFALRFSGTGTAWREAHKEHVFRPPEQYLTAEMCARIAGVPVVSVHPPSGNLDTDTFIETAIGAVCFGYVADGDGVQSDAGTELWCIARINDASAAAAMATGKFSTSPAVVFAADSGNETLKLTDGTSILFEGRPAVVDHLAAVIAEGVWDKGGAAGVGVRVDSNEGTKEMTEQRTQASGEMIDKMLSTLDSISKRLDALETGGKRADAERDAWLAEDAAQCARDDADEERERTELEGKGEAKEAAADKARSARRDRVRARKDARRADSQRRTAADAERKVQADNLEAQSRADAVARSWGETAPPPMAGEATMAYRARLARYHQKYCTEPSFKELDLAALAATQPAAFDGIERRIYADSHTASANPIGPDDQLITRTSVDPDTGHRITTFHGRHTFIYGLKRPTMRATGSFNTPNGPRAA